MSDDWPYDVQLEWDSYTQMSRVLQPVSFAGVTGGWSNMTIDLAVGKQRQTYLVVCGDCGGHFRFDNYMDMKDHDAEPEAICTACHSKRVRLFKADKNTVMEVVCRVCGFIFLSKPEEVSNVPVFGTPVFPNCPKCGKPDVYAMVPRERVGYDTPREGYDSPRRGCWNPLGFIEER